MQNSLAKVYFPGLNGLRFVAAFLVIVNHIETAKFYHGFPNCMHLPFFTSIGSLSVTLFFVLSGFLITYLLLQEKEIANFLNIKNFYIKRILRIWPLYFLIVFMSLFLLYNSAFGLLHVPYPLENNFVTTLFLFLIILPNVVAAFYPGIPYLHHTWSIGVEEQFYVIWPWIIRFTKNYIKVFVIVILATIFISGILRIASHHIQEITEDALLIKTIKKINVCFSMFRIGSMSIGAIGAWLLFYKKEKFLSIIFRKDTQVIIISLIILLYIISPPIPLIKHEIYSVLYCIIIINLAANTKSILNLENKIFNSLGKISYGIYIYHVLVIEVCLTLLKKSSYNEHIYLFNSTLYIAAVFFTIVISYLSYYLFERRFLKLKDNFIKEYDRNSNLVKVKS